MCGKRKDVSALVADIESPFVHLTSGLTPVFDQSVNPISESLLFQPG